MNVRIFIIISIALTNLLVFGYNIDKSSADSQYNGIQNLINSSILDELNLQSMIDQYNKETIETQVSRRSLSKRWSNRICLWNICSYQNKSKHTNSSAIQNTKKHQNALKKYPKIIRNNIFINAWRG